MMCIVRRLHCGDREEVAHVRTRAHLINSNCVLQNTNCYLLTNALRSDDGGMEFGSVFLLLSHFTLFSFASSSSSATSASCIFFFFVNLLWESLVYCKMVKTESHCIQIILQHLPLKFSKCLCAHDGKQIIYRTIDRYPHACVNGVHLLTTCPKCRWKQLARFFSICISA